MCISINDGIMPMQSRMHRYYYIQSLEGFPRPAPTRSFFLLARLSPKVAA